MIIDPKNYEHYYSEWEASQEDPGWDWDEPYWGDYIDEYPQFAHLPQRQGNYKYHGQDYSNYRYYRSWSKITKSLSKLSLEKYVGKRVDDVISKYRDRLRKVNSWYNVSSTVDKFYRITDLNKAAYNDEGELCLYWWRYELTPLRTINKPRYRRGPIYYVHPTTGLILVKRFKSPTESAQKRRVRLRKSAEKIKAGRKSDRRTERANKLSMEGLGMYFKSIKDWTKADVQRKKQELEKERAIDERKMISKGFDPITSFRKSINDG